MLVLTRRVNEKIRIGDNIVICICRITNDKVRIGIQAPENVSVMRSELLERPKIKSSEPSQKQSA